MRIGLIGPPGSGKGSQCVHLKERYGGMCYVNPHALMRDEVQLRTPLGAEAQDMMRNGEVVPEAMYTQAMLQKMQSEHCRSAGYILDGAPLSVEQARDLARHGEVLDVVVQLEVPEKTLRERLGGRWVHRNSGRIYHDKYAPPVKPGLDNITGEKLEQEHRDTPAVVDERLKRYFSTVGELIEFYRGPRNDGKTPVFSDVCAHDGPLTQSRPARVVQVDAGAGMDKVRKRLYTTLDAVAKEVRAERTKKPWWRFGF